MTAAARNGTQTGAPHVVVAGGGVGALEAVIALRALAPAKTRITLVAPDDAFVYRPMTVGEPFAFGPAPRVPLARVASEFDVDWRRDGLASVARDSTVALDSGESLGFDRLVVAIGAPRDAVYSHATSFRGEHDVEAIRALVDSMSAGRARRIAFVVPTGVAWSLPVYELALMVARRAFETSVDAELTVVTPEDRPLAVFGAAAAADLEQRLAAAGIRIVCRSAAEVPSPGRVVIHPGNEQIECDRIVALPVSRGPHLRGVTSDRDGFIQIDSFARVTGSAGVYAVGDATNFPLKQGGIACQQADAAAEHIAWSLGATLKPRPFRPVLRGQLLTGEAPQFIRRDISARMDARELSSSRPLWWPATKIAGRYLSAWLADSDEAHGASDQVAPGVRRLAFIAAASDDAREMPLRGYEYGGAWGPNSSSYSSG